jgi:isopropylmalate/homocitrate/citramalate synthase
MVGGVKIVEVGPRDGLQNEKVFVPTAVKARFIANLAGAGLETIEITSFVSPKWVPQLADAEELSTAIHLQPNYSALVPNLKGLERAVACGYEQIALFTAASETFCKRNLNMSRRASLAGFRDVIGEFRAKRGPDAFVRGYVSTAFECPYEGLIGPDAVVSVVEALFEMGVHEVSLGDTIGVAGPSEVKHLGGILAGAFGLDRLAFHFHDTRGTAIANVAAGMEVGVRIFDSSAGGLGGCPFAPGAGGNLATEDLLYFLMRESEEIQTGANLGRIDLEAVAAASLEVFETLGRRPVAKAQVAALANRLPGC